MEVIKPSTTSVANSDVYFCKDHIPHVAFNGDRYLVQDKYLYDANTLKDLVQDFDNKTFVLDSYQYFAGFPNSLIFPSYFLKETRAFACYFGKQRLAFGNKHYHFNYLSNKLREARILVSSWIANNWNKLDLTYTYTQSWSAENGMEVLPSLLEFGEINASAKTLDKLMYGEYVFGDNPKNFEENFLAADSAATAVSIVAEPVFWEHGITLTEKYIQALYSGTIPLILGYGAYDTLARMGFDSFTDIIDTSEQYNPNAVQRVWNTLEKNAWLLQNGIDLVQDRAVQERIEHNLAVISEPEELFYKSVTALNSEEQFEKLLAILIENRVPYTKYDTYARDVFLHKFG